MVLVLNNPSQVEAITRQIAYPDFIEVDRELDRYYNSVRDLVCVL